MPQINGQEVGGIGFGLMGNYILMNVRERERERERDKDR